MSGERSRNSLPGGIAIPKANVMAIISFGCLRGVWVTTASRR
jgi:hypothetical protein